MKFRNKIIPLAIMLSLLAACTDYLDEFNDEYESFFSYDDFDWTAADADFGSSITCEVKDRGTGAVLEAWVPNALWSSLELYNENGTQYSRLTEVYYGKFTANRDSICMEMSKKSASYVPGSFKCGSKGFTYTIETSQTVSDFKASAQSQCALYVGSSTTSSSSYTPSNISSDTPSYISSSSSLNSSSSGEINWDSQLIIDLRDFHVYGVTKIGSQIWMSENLNYETSSSYCYNNDTLYCAAYGRLYTWAAAQNACPTGWRLPVKEDWDTLYKYVEAAADGDTTLIGAKLKSTDTWMAGMPGTDDFGFTAYPAGVVNSELKFINNGYTTGFWTSERSSVTGYGIFLFMSVEFNNIYTAEDLDDNGALSVRCIFSGGG